ncbi:MAG: hypothetical protein HY894_01300 [Deltaproteobacteria bacterium]|nr:hypothetical protein [Deltaproteobacteria bacterium]
MDDVKVCPRCEAEYYAHVSECASCGVPLVAPHEAAAREALPEAEGELVCVMEGPLDKVTELSGRLKKSGFETEALKIAGAGGCSPDSGFGVFVAKNQAAAAVGKMEEFWHGLHPEMKAAQERMNAGLCPACGAALNPANPECPDCGLFLGDPSCGNVPGCGSCER